MVSASPHILSYIKWLAKVVELTACGTWYLMVSAHCKPFNLRAWRLEYLLKTRPLNSIPHRLKTNRVTSTSHLHLSTRNHSCWSLAAHWALVRRAKWQWLSQKPWIRIPWLYLFRLERRAANSYHFRVYCMKCGKSSTLSGIQSRFLLFHGFF